jgi:hypothetical protein
MAFESNLSSRSVPCNGDLSSNQYYIVKLNSSGKLILTAAATDVPYGILQNKAKSTGEVGVVAVAGLSKLVMGEACSIGDRIAPLNSGKGQVAGAGERAFAIARGAAGADGDIIPVEILAGELL